MTNDSCNTPVFKVHPSGAFSRKTRKQRQNEQVERECKIKQRELKREKAKLHDITRQKALLKEINVKERHHH